MWLLTHAFAVVLMLAMSALAAIAVLIAHAMAVDRRHRMPSCPCCTLGPAQSDDCSCREDCGVTWCQAYDPGDHIEGCGPGRNLLAYPSLACPACDQIAARRGACPWCGTHECRDSSQCNCGEPCGSGICMVKEASRG